MNNKHMLGRYDLYSFEFFTIMDLIVGLATGYANVLSGIDDAAFSELSTERITPLVIFFTLEVGLGVWGGRPNRTVPPPPPWGMGPSVESPSEVVQLDRKNRNKDPLETKS